MKQQIENLLQIAVTKLQEAGELPAIPAFIQIDATKDKQYGDYASNIALVLARPAQKKPREVAERIIRMIPPSQCIQKIEIAGPGFINFFLSPEALTDVIANILKEKENFGRSKMGRGKRVLVEFVSSNPTGPLHVGHGRHAAFGAVMSNLLDTVGFNVYREYYVNDAGRQVDILAASVWLRYLALCGEEMVFPANAYRGEYVIDIAKLLHDRYSTELKCSVKDVFNDLPPDEPNGGDKEVYIDAVIERMKQALDDRYQAVSQLALTHIIDDMRNDLAEFGVEFDNWFSERAFVATNAVAVLIDRLKQDGHVYEKEGALWFRSTDFGDEKDRVLVRSNGQYTYFAPDVAYHLNKFERGFDIALDIMGSDHHGYFQRMKAAMESLGVNPERLLFLTVQFVSLFRGGQPMQMSTRGGEFVTLRELRKEVGNDAARFFYVMRKAEQPMDFDLELAKAQSNENPVYYVQYAHARICSVLKQMVGRNMRHDFANGLRQLTLLTAPEERELLNTLARYPDVIFSAALQYEPHQLTNYLRDLATDFHAYYNAQQFLVEDAHLRDARLSLMMAIKQILLNGFGLLGISAPEVM